MVLVTAVYIVAAREALLVSTELEGDVGGGASLALGENLRAIAKLSTWPMRAPLPPEAGRRLSPPS